MEPKRHPSSLAPYVVPFFIFCGTYRLMTFYQAFGINVLRFLDFSEVLLSFFDLLYLLLAGSIGWTLTSFLLRSKEFEDDEVAASMKVMETESFFRRCKIYLELCIQLIGAMLTYIVIDLIGWVFNLTEELHTAELMSILLMLLALFIIYFEIGYKHKKLNSSPERISFINLLFLSFLVLAVITAYVYADVKHIKNNKINSKIQVQFKDGWTFYSNENEYFLGKTDNFIFLYNQSRDETKVVSMDEVKSILFVKKDRF